MLLLGAQLNQKPGSKKPNTLQSAPPCGKSHFLLIIAKEEKKHKVTPMFPLTSPGGLWAALAEIRQDMPAWLPNRSCAVVKVPASPVPGLAPSDQAIGWKAASWSQ